MLSCGCGAQAWCTPRRTLSPPGSPKGVFVSTQCTPTPYIEMQYHIWYDRESACSGDCMVAHAAQMTLLHTLDSCCVNDDLACIR